MRTCWNAIPAGVGEVLSDRGVERPTGPHGPGVRFRPAGTGGTHTHHNPFRRGNDRASNGRGRTDIERLPSDRRYAVPSARPANLVNVSCRTFHGSVTPARARRRRPFARVRGDDSRATSVCRFGKRQRVRGHHHLTEFVLRLQAVARGVHRRRPGSCASTGCSGSLPPMAKVVCALHNIKKSCLCLIYCRELDPSVQLWQSPVSRFSAAGPRYGGSPEGLADVGYHEAQEGSVSVCSSDAASARWSLRLCADLSRTGAGPLANGVAAPHSCQRVA